MLAPWVNLLPIQPTLSKCARVCISLSLCLSSSSFSSSSATLCSPHEPCHTVLLLLMMMTTQVRLAGQGFDAARGRPLRYHVSECPFQEYLIALPMPSHSLPYANGCAITLQPHSHVFWLLAPWFTLLFCSSALLLFCSSALLLFCSSFIDGLGASPGHRTCVYIHCSTGGCAWALARLRAQCATSCSGGLV